MPPTSRNQIQELLSMRGTPARLAHGGPAEAPRGVVEPQPPTVEVRAASSQDVETAPPTDTTPSGAAAAHPRPDEAMNQAATSSSAIVSRGGEHAKRPADPTVEGEIQLSETKRPRGRPVTHTLPMPSAVEYTEGCPGCMGDGYYHNAQCKRRKSSERSGSISRGRCPSIRESSCRKSSEFTSSGRCHSICQRKQCCDISCGRCKLQSS